MCYRTAHFAGVDALWKNAFLDDRTWNVASAEIPQKTRFQPDLMLLALEGNLVAGSVSWIRWTSRLDLSDRLVKSLGKSDRAGAHCSCRRAACDTRLRQSQSPGGRIHLSLARTTRPRGYRPLSAATEVATRYRQAFEFAIVMTGHCVGCLCQTAPRPRPSRGRSDGKRPGPAMAPVRLFSAGADAPLHRETKWPHLCHPPLRCGPALPPAPSRASAD